MKGSIRPVRLFTVDVSTEDMIPIQDPLASKGMKERKQIRDKARKVFFQRLYSGQTTTWKEITQDYDFIELRRGLNKDFDDLFARAYKSYIEGNWAVAGKGLKQLVKLRPRDGPSCNLNKVVNIQHQGKAPADWKGFRPLTSK